MRHGHGNLSANARRRPKYESSPLGNRSRRSELQFLRRKSNHVRFRSRCSASNRARGNRARRIRWHRRSRRHVNCRTDDRSLASCFRRGNQYVTSAGRGSTHDARRPTHRCTRRSDRWWPYCSGAGVRPLLAQSFGARPTGLSASGRLVRLDRARIRFSHPRGRLRRLGAVRRESRTTTHNIDERRSRAQARGTARTLQRQLRSSNFGGDGHSFRP